MGSLRHMGDGEQEELPFPKLDDLKPIGDQRRGGKQAVSVNAKMGRLVIYQHAYKIFETRSGRATIEYVQLLRHQAYPHVFWIRACGERDKTARKIHTTGDTKVISAKKLISEIGKTDADTEQYYADWDPQNGALYVDLNRPI
jgi:hypothetical protein